MPERWKKGAIVPAAKKRGAMKLRDHRGVTLSTTYVQSICIGPGRKTKKRSRRKRDDTGKPSGM